MSEDALKRLSAKQDRANAQLPLPGVFVDPVKAPQSTAKANPKDAYGAAKPSLSFVPPIAMMHEAKVMSLGAAKYGPFNWRDHPVQAKIYADAAIRHILQWLDGEELDEQSLASHLAHARACCGILLDAQHVGNLIDDRHKSGTLTGAIAALTKPLNL